MAHPSLPSIHFLLNEHGDSIQQSTDSKIITTSTVANTAPSITQPPPTPPPPPALKRHHRQSHSISSLPSELQQLSLSAPVHNNYNIPTTERSENHQPSWMMMAPSSTPFIPTTHHSNRRTHNSHIRSVSDLSMINLVTHPSLTQVRNQRHQTHKRSASANTTTTTIMHNHNTSSGSLPLIDEHSTTSNTTTSSRARTHSPPTKYTDSPQQKLLLDALNINNERQHPTLFLNQVEEGSVQLVLHKDRKKASSPTPPPSTSTTTGGSTVPKEYENVMVARDEQTGRYYCPFCNKAFNRPSSLRIHTYSHTGEKPFVCQEEGCGRQFSVQSNMRRHLRVHRLGRAKATK